MAKTKPVENLERVVIRFAGDSGDGMQLTGDRFTSETAVFGNDLATLPDFPAEIRAPAGSLPGVSGFQVHFADHDILTPGDQPSVLVAMNPAALKVNLSDLAKGGTVIVNTDAFYGAQPAEGGLRVEPARGWLALRFHVHEVALSSMTVEALKEVEGITSREAERSKNFFALGLMSWLYHRPAEGTLAFIETKFAARPEIAEANTKAFKAGWNYGETSEDFAVSYEIAPAKLEPGTYRQVSGNTALTYGSDRGEQAVRAAVVSRRLPDYAGFRRPRAARPAEAVRRAHLPGRGRDRSVRGRTWCRLRRRARSDDLCRPGNSPEVGDGGPRSDARASARRRRRAAGRAFHGDAHEARAG